MQDSIKNNKIIGLEIFLKKIKYFYPENYATNKWKNICVHELEGLIDD